MGIGINTGPVILGNIGSASRVKYGVVGAAVNTTSRIESNSLGGQVLLGEATYDLIKDAVQVEKPRTAMMKGISRPLVFYPRSWPWTSPTTWSCPGPVPVPGRPG